MTLRIDGSHGEGGGQLVRFSVALSAITGKPVEIDNIRAKREHPGLAAQHVTAVRAVAAICGASTEGATLGSSSLRFEPGGPASSGEYEFDVAEAREGGSAGAITLVMQAVLPALLRSTGTSRLLLRGGTHVAWSPPLDYAQYVWLPTLAGLGVRATITMRRSGWYPEGGGEVVATVRGGANLLPLNVMRRGRLLRLHGRALTANLPSHIPQRMASRARSLLSRAGIDARIDTERVRAACAGTGLFLVAQYEGGPAGFSALGEPRKPSEQVAEEAVAEVLAHRSSGAALDRHLADQVLLPLALGGEASRFSVERRSGHLDTSAWLIERFGLAGVGVEESDTGPVVVTVSPD